MICPSESSRKSVEVRHMIIECGLSNVDFLKFIVWQYKSNGVLKEEWCMGYKK